MSDSFVTPWTAARSVSSICEISQARIQYLTNYQNWQIHE